MEVGDFIKEHRDDYIRFIYWLASESARNCETVDKMLEGLNDNDLNLLAYIAITLNDVGRHLETKHMNKFFDRNLLSIREVKRIAPSKLLPFMNFNKDVLT